MRPTTSALTTTILGAALAASTVSAQQYPQSAGPRRDSSAVPASVTESTPTNQAGDTVATGVGSSLDPVIGMAATRGARYLLRNGVDYIEYQEYERALKYLREAEVRQKELNPSEKLALKQAIERAQRGLREAVNAQTPYALSRRSRRAGGFAPARSEIQTAADTAASNPSPPTAKAVRATSREGDDRGDPIQLAGAELITPPAAAVSTGAMVIADRTAAPGALPEPLPIAPEKPVALAEALPAETSAAPKLDAAAQVAQADLNFPLPPLSPVGESQPRQTDQATPLETAAEVKAPTASEPKAATEPEPKATTEPEPKAATEPEPKAATEPAVQPPTNRLPAEGVKPAPQPAPINLEPPADLETRPASDVQVPASTEADAVPLPPLGNDSSQDKSSSPPSKPSLTATKEDSQAQAPVAQPPGAEPVSTATATDGLPLLPQQAPAEEKIAAPEAPRPEATTPKPEPEAPAVAVVPDDLPPLPSEVTRQADTKAVTEPLPAAAEDLPGLPSAGPGQSDTAGSQPAGRPEQAGSPSAAAEPVPAEPTALVSPVPGPASSPAPETASPAGRAEQARPEAAGVTPGANQPPQASEAPKRAVPVEVTGPDTSTATARRMPAAVAASSELDAMLPRRELPPSSLLPEQRRRVEEVARRQDEESRQSQARPVPGRVSRDPGTGLSPDSRSQTMTQVDISRAPSPAEARPIRAIPVPDEWVPLGRREWSPQRKYWAAAATCHLPLYFQDTMLERYGHSVENYFGPAGRCMTYPVDDPRQSTQRNQVAQPFFSAGLFAWQILTLPYALVVDPPWEAQYDLGYWRPGDKIPTDLYYQPLHGTGPPLRGRQY